MRAESLKGHLDGMILAVVGAAPAHGYAVIEELRRRSGGAFDLPEGTVYPALHRLERAGFLASRWLNSEYAGRRRRVYRLTRRGQRALARHRQEWSTFSRALAATLKPIQ